MKRVKISVIIPVFNAGEYLERCLYSVINNTYENLEILCIDDGSTDSSFEVFHDQTDPRVVVVHQEK